LISILLLLIIARGSYPTPFWDEFYFTKLYSGAINGNVDISELFAAHNGHILFVTKFWLWLVLRYSMDWRLSSYMQIPLIAFTTLFLVRAYFLKCEDSKKGLHASAANISTVITISLTLGSARQWENLYWSMQVGVYFMLLSSVVALFYLSIYSTSKKARDAFIANLAGVVAMGSFGSGIITFLMVTISLWIISSNALVKRIALLQFASFAVLLALAQQLGSIENHLARSQNLLIPSKVIQFILLFFSNSIMSHSNQGNISFSLMAGILILLLSTYCVYRSAKTKSLAGDLFPLLLIGFSFLTCIAIAYSRLKNGTWQPDAPRYYPISAIMIVGDCLLLGSSRKQHDKILSKALALVVAVSFLQSYASEWMIAPYRKEYLRARHSSLCSGESIGLAFYAEPKAIDLDTVRRVFCDD